MTALLSPSAAAQQSRSGGTTPARVAGADRFETAARLADEAFEGAEVVGGGVSQLGTTFLNAAWYAGIDVVDFRQHRLYFERYPVCHEATLSWGSLDVVVRNDSPYDIVIDSYSTDEFVGVRFISRDWAQVGS